MKRDRKIKIISTKTVFYNSSKSKFYLDFAFYKTHLYNIFLKKPIFAMP